MKRVTATGRQWIARIWAILNGPPPSRTERDHALVECHHSALVEREPQSDDLFANVTGHACTANGSLAVRGAAFQGPVSILRTVCQRRDARGGA
jgi:hypothetical protein